MLGSALLLQMIVKLYSNNILIEKNRKRERKNSFETPVIKEAPPPLNEIYIEINAQHWEEELLIKKIMEKRSDISLDNNHPAAIRCHHCNEIRENKSINFK